MNAAERSELERQIYRRVLVECRFAFSNIIFRGYAPRYAEYVVEQIQGALDLPAMNDEQVQVLAVRVQALSGGEQTFHG